jgi:hypothetical protein
VVSHVAQCRLEFQHLLANQVEVLLEVAEVASVEEVAQS